MHNNQRLSREEIKWGDDPWPAMRGTWEELVRLSEDASAFLTPSWVEAWIETFGERARPTGVVWSSKEGPVACAFLSTTKSRLGPFPISQLRLNASGGAGVGTEHNDVVAVVPYRQQVLDDLVAMMVKCGTDEVALDGVRPELFDSLRVSWPVSTWSGHKSESPYVSLTANRETADGFLSMLSSNTRAQIRRSRRLYEDAFGEASVSVAASESEANEWLAELIALHEATWNSRGKRGGFVGEARAFHRRLFSKAFRSDQVSGLRVDLVRIRFGEETIGLLYNLVAGGRVQFYQSGFRYDDDARLKPGLTSHVMAIDHYTASDELEYDFLGGDPQPVRYKRSLSQRHRYLYWAQLPAPSMKMRTIEWIRRLRRRLRTRHE